MRPWSVYVRRGDRSVYVGQVHADNEEWARCAALSRYGVTDDELRSAEAGDPAASILPDDEFEVQPA